MPKGKWTLQVSLLVGQFLVCQYAFAANWPRFRGPNGNGVAHDKDIPVQFDLNNGILWKIPIPGLGNSSPIIWDNNLFVQTATADGKKRLLLCLDATTGKMIWSQGLPGAKAHINPKNSWASSTPATDGAVVVNAFWDGKEVILAAYDFKGKLAWSRNFGSFKSQHGAGASPIIFQDKVFFANDQDGDSILWALDKTTGAVAWKAARQAFRACYSAPFILEKPAADPELIVTSTSSIKSYHPDTGSPNWSWKWSFAGMPLRTTGSPIFTHGTIYACSGDGAGDRHMAAVKLGNNGNRTQPETVWENKRDFPYVPTMLSRDDYLYFVNDRGYAGCFLARDGKQVWLVRQPEATFTSSPVMIDGKMYAASEEGDVYVFAAETTYQLLARNALGERVRASLAVANNRLYIRGQNHLFCIGKRK